MKKNLRKLVLSKETVRNLENPALREAVGGTGDCTYLCVTTNGRWECANACIEP